LSAPEKSTPNINKKAAIDNDDDIQVTQFDFNYSPAELLKKKLSKNRDGKSLEQILFQRLIELRTALLKVLPVSVSDVYSD
jgi:hypothetical protein